MYEAALSEWGLTPDYINHEFTEELLFLMFLKRKERLERLLPPQEGQVAYKKVSDKTFFGQHGFKIKEMK